MVQNTDRRQIQLEKKEKMERKKMRKISKRYTGKYIQENKKKMTTK